MYANLPVLFADLAEVENKDGWVFLFSVVSLALCPSPLADRDDQAAEFTVMPSIGNLSTKDRSRSFPGIGGGADLHVFA